MNPSGVIRTLLVALLAAFGGSLSAQSILASGDWFKLSVKNEGIHKIDFDLLRKMGLNPSAVNPDRIRLYGSIGGMLPQSNSASRPPGLSEIPLYVTGSSDGKFDRGDVIFFYATGADHAALNASRGVFSYQHNLFSEENFYFLTISDQNGKRVDTAANLASTANVVTSFNDFVYHEKDEHNELHSGREWYGEKFSLALELELSFDIPGIVPGTDITIVSDVMGQSYASAAFNLFMNGVPVGQQPILPIPAGRYSTRGYDRRDTLTINEASAGAAARSEQKILYRFQKASGFSQGYLDFILVNFRRQLRLYENQTIFSSAASLSNPVTTFVVDDTGPSDQVWDITDPFDVRIQTSTHEGGATTFTTETDRLKKFVVFKADVDTPDFVGRVSNQNLSGMATPGFLIITHPALEQEARRLADHRASTGWTVSVVTVFQIYNEFSSGRQDVTAIRDFIRELNNKSPGVLKAVLMFGKASYDYKDRLQDNTNLVPTYESRNSLAPLQTYSSDDYFGFLEPNEGEWPESPAMAHSLDIGVGRLPVLSVGQARTVVDKIIEYDKSLSAKGYWRKRIAFVADDGNSEDGFTSLHQFQADALARSIDDLQPGFDTKKLYMGRYEKVVRPNGEFVPQMTDDILDAFESGSLIINFTGHGSEQVWTDERVLSDQIIGDLENKIYPFLVTATCEFGRHDDPFQTSSAELSITRRGGGSIGLVTTARPVNATTNFELNRAFYEALFIRDAAGFSPLGEVFRSTKNNSLIGVSNRNFSLLADPSMKLALPHDVAVVTSIKTSTGSDTLKALSRVIITGHIEDAAGEKLSDYDGIAEAVLYNKEDELVTIGRNNPPFQFREWSNILFRGRATVTSGDFTFEFIVPRNISYPVVPGKLGVYAYEKDSGRDANGYSNTFKVGGTEQSPPQDVTPPQIRAFIGDSTFVNGGTTDPNTYLIALLRDESGINISSYGIGNGIIATLDNDETVYVLNDYYTAETDDFSRGTVRFPLRGLAPGRHTLTINAWDTYNNSARATISFTVTDGDGIRIETLGNYPNPFTDETTIFFTHNRSGDDLEAQLFIYSAAGMLVEAVQIPVSQSEYKVDLIELGNSEKKLPAGLYLARVVVRSLSDGSKNEQVTKLIVLN